MPEEFITSFDEAIDGAAEVQGWKAGLEERELRLVRNCVQYATMDPAGMPGHMLAIIVSKLAGFLTRIEALQGPVVFVPADDGEEV